LKKFSSDNLKGILCIHTDISNKPDLIIDDLSASTSHPSDIELDFIVIKPVIVDIACLDNIENSCLNDRVKTKSKELETQGKFAHTCHNCGKVGHIRPNCYLLKFPTGLGLSRLSLKSAKLRILLLINMSRPLGDIYLKKIRTLFCVRMLNPQFAEHVKKHFSKQRQPICHHCGVTRHIWPHSH